MHRRVAAVLIASSLLLAAAPVRAELEHSIGLGFRRTSTPIGARWWLTPKVAVDGGFGISAEEVSVDVDLEPPFDGDPDTRVTDTLASWTLDVGVPWAAWSGDRIRLLLRPGFEYHSEDDFESFAATSDRVKASSYAVTGEVEVEVNVWKNLTVSAAHGVEYRSSKVDLPGAESSWTAGTTGNDFFSLGFFLYLWGPPKN